MTSQDIKIKDDEFILLRDLINSTIGINLTNEKRTLLVVRLQKVLKKLNLATFKDYYNYIKNDTSGAALSQLATTVSTNFTYFYREEGHFDFFKKTALPKFIQEQERLKSKKLRIWCAGCSSGEEPYMLVMLMKELLGVNYNSWDAGVLATDISDNVLSIAKSAIYEKDGIARVPENIKSKYFKKISDDKIKVVNDVIKEVTFRKYNLMNVVLPFKTKFHIIFCRNVMIYFDNKTRDALVKRFADALSPGGYLFIGHSETIGRDNIDLNYILPAVYQKR